MVGATLMKEIEKLRERPSVDRELIEVLEMMAHRIEAGERMASVP